jgi:hypothetical protein
MNSSIDVILPKNFEKYPSETKEDIIKYLIQLTPIEKKAYLIAMDHLGTSFNIVKSNGFNDWIKDKQ